MINKETLNLYGERCTPIRTKVVTKLNSMNTGDVLVLNSDNHCALKKIRTLCYSRGHIVEIFKIDNNAMRYIIKIQ